MTVSTILGKLEESRRRERVQTQFYRALAAEAEKEGDESLVDRLNQLHADEQHHLSRLTARLLELGGRIEAEELPDPGKPSLQGWEVEARRREEEEVDWYEGLLAEAMDGPTRELFTEILDSEQHHARDLGGKWMPAS